MRLANEELQRLALPDRHGDVHCGFIAGLAAGQPIRSACLRPVRPVATVTGSIRPKLLVDPYALAIDRPFVFSTDLCLPPDRAVDTAPLVPKAVVATPPSPLAVARWGTRHTQPAAVNRHRPDLIYELNVRAFTKLQPDVPLELRGTVAALRAPAVLDHFGKLGVTAVELMPVAAWIDERHLPPLGLANAWGYNPITMMALDPRLAPGGLADLADTVAALHAAGIEVLLDVVFNHSGESDAVGPTLSFRGLDNASYYRLDAAIPPATSTTPAAAILWRSTAARPCSSPSIACGSLPAPAVSMASGSILRPCSGGRRAALIGRRR